MIGMLYQKCKEHYYPAGVVENLTEIIQEKSRYKIDMNFSSENGDDLITESLIRRKKFKALY